MSFSILQENYRQVREEYSKRNKSNNESHNPAEDNIKKALDDCERILELYKDLDNTIDETIEEHEYSLLAKRERDQLTNDTQAQNYRAKNFKIKEHNQLLPTPTDSDYKNKINKNSNDQTAAINSILAFKNTIGDNQPSKGVIYHNNQISQVHTNSKQSDLYPITPNDKQYNFNTKNSVRDKIYQEQSVHKIQHENQKYKPFKINNTQSTSINQRALVSKNVNKNQIRASIHQSNEKKPIEYNSKNYLDSIEQPRNLKNNHRHAVNNNEYYKVPPIRRLSADSMYEDKKENPTDNGLEATEVIGPVRTFEPKYITINNKKYMILSNIGEGGYGAVYKAYDVNTEQVLAIKDVKGKGEGEELKKSVLNEVYFLRQAKERKFKYTVKMYDYQILPYGYKIVMELGDIDFQKALRKQIEDHPINMNYVRYFWGQILYAVKEWHETFTLHKDLKPQNFILKDGRIKLIDFGTTIALGSNRVETSERAVGTLNYMAPETLIASNGLSEAGLPADIWSLGCILYEMIYKKPPLHRYDETRKRIILYTREEGAIKYPNHVDWIPTEGDYEEKLVNTTYVDDSAIDCMKSCLNYDAKKRPTIDQLIDHPFIKYYEIKY